YIDYITRPTMARVAAEKCTCGCKMKRLYIRSDGGKGWDSVGWLCTCGCACVSMDETWQEGECCSRNACC
ncbi:MAG: hypothetical protein VXA43_05980, partial [Candidatus Poseidoniales archaeon]